MFSLAKKEKPFSAVPVWVLIVFVLALSMQIFARSSALTSHNIQPQDLKTPTDTNTLRLISVGEPEILSIGLMLWLQSFDNQPGISIPLADLDYKKVVGWLTRITELDPRSQYPLFFACHIYGRVNDPDNLRLIISFIYDRFKQNPNHNWRWLAHSVVLAKHRLKDIKLATHLAAELRLRATGKQVPHWAKQMEIGLLETQGEYETAALLIGGLIQSGQITDPQELLFLNQRLINLNTQ